MLILETGVGVPGAESYALASELVARAAAYGWTIPATEAEQEMLLRRAAEAMDAIAWKGSRVSQSQSLAWPRNGVVVDGEAIPSTLIPTGIQYGQMALAAEIHADDVVPPESVKGAVTEETVDVITIKYATVSNEGKVLRAAPYRPSAVQFRPYVQTHTFIRAIRA